MPKLGDGTTDAVNRVHDADQDPNYRKIKEPRPANRADVDMFRSTLEQGKKEGDGSAESKTDELASELQKSLLARVGKADPSDLRMAPETSKASKGNTPTSKDEVQDKDELDDRSESGEGAGAEIEAAASDSVASGDADPAAQPAQQDQTGSPAPDPSHHGPEANPSMQQSQNDPNQSAQLSQMMHGQQSQGGFDKAGVLHDHRGSEAVHAAEQLRKTKRDADKGDPADPPGNAAATQMKPIVQTLHNSNNEVSDAKKAERSRTEELNKLADKLMSDVSQILVSMEDSGTKEVTVVLSPDVLPDTSFTVSFSNKGVEVKFQTKNGKVADKINDVRGSLEKRFRRTKGLEVTVPVVTGGSDDLGPGV